MNQIEIKVYDSMGNIMLSLDCKEDKLIEGIFALFNALKKPILKLELSI